MAAPNRERLYGVLVKVESVSGTDAVPVVATDGVRIAGPSALLETNFMEEGARDDVQTGILSGADRAPAVGWWGRITIPIEMKGAGAVYSASVKPAGQDALWRGSGCIVSTDFTGGAERYLYSTLDQGMETVTVYGFSAGKRFIMVGCAVAPSLSAEVYKRGIINFVITGKMVSVTEFAFPAITLSGVIPPEFHSAPSSGMAIGSWNGATVGDPLMLVSASVNLGTVVADLSSAGAADGLAGWLITDRKVTQDLTYYAPALATFDPFAQSKAAGDVPLITSWQVGTVQYNRVKVSCRWAPRAPREGTRNGAKTYQQSGDCKVGGGLTLSREFEILYN